MPLSKGKFYLNVFVCVQQCVIMILAVNTSVRVCVVPLKAERTAAAGADAAAGGVFAAQTGGRAVQRWQDETVTIRHTKKTQHCTLSDPLYTYLTPALRTLQKCNTHKTNWTNHELTVMNTMFTFARYFKINKNVLLIFLNIFLKSLQHMKKT